MGKTKIKIIDDSQPKEAKSLKLKKKSKEEDTLVAKLKQELGIEEQSRRSALRTPVSPSAPEQESGAADQSEKSQKTQKPGKVKPRSKKYQEIVKDLDRAKTYPIDEAVDMVKKMSYAKFNATIEAHINTTQTGLRGFLQLPYASGKKLRILVFGPSHPQTEGVIFGDNSTLEEIEKGKVDFDLIITTPQWMPKLAKVAKILGPRGLMPNPKNGTIIDPSADGLKKAVVSFQAGKTEYKTEPKAPVIHLALGKLNQPTEELSANVKTLLQTLGKTRIKKVALSPTMGPSVKVDLSSI